jgi:hypothetical protein
VTSAKIDDRSGVVCVRGNDNTYRLDLVEGGVGGVQHPVVLVEPDLPSDVGREGACEFIAAGGGRGLRERD